jgi:hypothetical protein
VKQEWDSMSIDERYNKSNGLRSYYKNIDAVILKEKNTKASIIAAEKSAKSYEATSPNGSIISFKNLRKFCRDNNLSFSGMNSVAKGIQSHHRKWTCYELSENGERIISFVWTKKRVSEWILISPNGEKSVCDNLKKFCKDNSLSYTSMSKVANGKMKHHKDWKVERDGII